MARRFVGVPLNHSISGTLDARLRSVGKATSMRWTSSESWHITLAFCGNVSDAEVGALVDVARECAMSEPFDVALGSAVVFAGRVLAAEVVDSSSGLSMLAGDVRRELGRAGISVDGKPFHPHVTLARSLAGHQVTSEARHAIERAAAGLTWRVDRVVVWRSELGRGSGVYVAEESVAMVGSG